MSATPDPAFADPLFQLDSSPIGSEPAVALENVPKWLVAHTKPRCEKKFSTLLNAECFEHELPLITSIRRYRTQTKRFAKPLFPGYVFVCVESALKYRLFQQDLLVRIIAVENQEKFVFQLETVRALIRSGFELQLTPPLEKGMRVRITGGVLFGVEGIVDNPKHPRGVVVSIDVLQQGVLVRLPPDQIEVITQD
ncbi:MAG TPA: transcription termination/antitermination NusG family protein [Opitutaceae bacterium]